ncbi:MAG: rhodanese [Methylomonas sp.]|jgi:rhodanese-related sulfurtransferase|nr:MAG: rhodanese [Methylomonas sp.]
MIKFLTLLISSLVFSANLAAGELVAVSPEQLLDMQQQNNALVVDIRTEAEWQASGIIANSHKLQSFDSQGHFDEDKWLADLNKMKSSPDQPVILVCRSGSRSAKVGSLLTQKMGVNNVYHLDNGLQSWLKTNHPVSANCTQIACK